MAERKPVQNETLSVEELARLKQRLASMGVTPVYDFYHAAYYRCRLEGDCIPPARAIQELVTAWRQLRKWK